MKYCLLLLLNCLFLLCSAQNTDYFHTFFDRNAQERKDENAYLLGYVSYLSYPKYLFHYMQKSQPHLSDSIQNQMDRDNAYFLEQFREHTKVLWGDLPKENYQIFASANNKKYDPEAILVQDDSTMWLVFRGTDSIMTRKNDFLRVYGEWLTTDFNVKLVQNQRYSYHGKVHRGFSKSLDYIVEDLAEYILKNGGRYKKMVTFEGVDLFQDHCRNGLV